MAWNLNVCVVLSRRGGVGGDRLGGVRCDVGRQIGQAGQWGWGHNKYIVTYHSISYIHNITIIYI